MTLRSLVPVALLTAMTTHLASAGWLHVEGSKIVDAANHTVVFHGVNSSGMEWGAGFERVRGVCETNKLGCWSRPFPDEYRNLAAWGFNMVRLPISWANLEPKPPMQRADGSLQHQYNATYLAAVEEIVRQFGQRGIYVVLSMHQWGWSPALEIEKHGGKVVHGNGLPVWLYDKGSPQGQQSARNDFFANRGGVQESLADVWGHVAAHFKDDATVVGMDMFNEPELKDQSLDKQRPPVGPTDLDMLYRKLGAAIRKVSPQVLLVFQDSASEPVSALPPFANVVYSFHSYPKGENWEHERDTWIDAHRQRATRWNVPLWLGEFQVLGGKRRPDGPDGFVQKTRPALHYYQEHGIGWSYWAYQKATRPIAGEHGDGPVNEPMMQLLRSGF